MGKDIFVLDGEELNVVDAVSMVSDDINIPKEDVSKILTEIKIVCKEFDKYISASMLRFVTMIIRKNSAALLLGASMTMAISGFNRSLDIIRSCFSASKSKIDRKTFKAFKAQILSILDKFEKDFVKEGS